MESYNVIESMDRNQMIIVGSALLSGICFANFMDNVVLEATGLHEEACMVASCVSILSIGLAQLSLISRSRLLKRSSMIMASMAAIAVGASCFFGAFDPAVFASAGIVCSVPLIASFLIR